MFRDADVGGGGSLQRYLMQISTGTITYTHTNTYIYTSTYYLMLERNAITLPGSRDYAARLRVNIGRTSSAVVCDMWTEDDWRVGERYSSKICKDTRGCDSRGGGRTEDDGNANVRKQSEHGDPRSQRRSGMRHECGVSVGV